MTSSGEPDAKPPRLPTVFVCTTCRRPEDPEDAPRAGAALAAALQETADPSVVTIRPVGCLANCKRGPSAALGCKGAWTYMFGGLAAIEDATALLEGARLLAASEDGLLPWRGRPEILKRNMICRFPPLEFPT